MAPDPRTLSGVQQSDLHAVRSSASTPSLRSKDGNFALSRMEKPGGGNIRVVVRVRGFLPREVERGAECLISMNPMNQTTTLLLPNESDPTNTRSKMRKVTEEKIFAFDNSFWSHNKTDDHYAHQSDVYNSLGEEFLDHNFEGYHTCIFAYGQTGSGKSYTMMGTPEEPGLIPRTCEDLFERIEAARQETPNISYHVRVSYFEVYNEHVRDLLAPTQPNQPPYYLKIRESPTEGPYIKNLTDAPVRNIKEIMKYMKMGDGNRTVASTKMNDTSSRSHAVFTIMLKQIHHDMDRDETTERVARIRLVDLAGSERAKAIEATGVRLREGSNINKSLTTLGRVIAALADPKQYRPGKRNRDIVPYRDSILTWLLKDSLGGNSKTAMIACIAPSDYDETLSTLRYADQAKRIRTRAIINQDQITAAERDAQIAAMAEEIRLLQLSISDSRRKEKEDSEKEDEVEKWQLKVSDMQRAMEEKDMVQSGKIRSLQTENEALRLHLRLLLEHHKNPIEIHNNSNSSKKSLCIAQKNNGENAANRNRKKVPHFWDEDDKMNENYEDEAIDVSLHEERISETRLEMQELLSDLSMFKKKLSNDKKQFSVL
ncbi:kinesin motor domain-containing protein, partial [Erysiphe pulchra]